MKKRILFCAMLFTGLLLSPLAIYAQEPDTIALDKNAFEDNFYEALKQKGIENYDKALLSLEKCLADDPDNPVVYHEIGKNYLLLMNYPEAEKAFLKATQLDPSNRWYWVGLYDVYYQMQDFNKSIPVVQKLTEWRREFYQEDLVSLYMYTQQYDKALALINELEQTVGQTDRREMYKLQILSNNKNSKPEKQALEEAIRKNPKVESNYLDLIYLYSESNEEEKAEEVARKLQKEIPESDWAQVGLFKFHINKNEGDEAVKSMFRVLESEKIDKKIKHRVLNEFLIYVSNNPKYNTELEKAVNYFESDEEINVPKEIGKFFFIKRDFTKAQQYFEKSLGNNADDIETVELLLYTYMEAQKYPELLQKADEYLGLYPTQAKLYYFAGYAANRQQEFKKAKDYLESGIDFVVEDLQLEAGFNRQLGEAYAGLGDEKKKEAYFSKATKLEKPEE